MRGAADFRNAIVDARSAEAVRVVDDATVLDVPVDGLDAHTTAGDAPIGSAARVRAGHMASGWA
jgi:hypothetical protein